jgi:MinD superfamily P-loop ATPase
MKIAIASGKGGTGKTTLATNLASYLAEQSRVVLVDLDVEEPNSGLFVKGELVHSEIKHKMISEWRQADCTLCGLCQEVCNFHAVLQLGDQILVFPQLCHGCYACSELCPTDTLPMIPRRMGELKHWRIGALDFVESRLDIGQEQAVPLISQTNSYVDEYFPDETIVLFDSPPGTACPVIESVKDVDFVILVTEPTPFGLHDLKLAVDTMHTLHKKFGVVINRHGVGNDEVIDYCSQEDLPILARIPNDRRIAEMYSRGELIYRQFPEVKQQLKGIMAIIMKNIQGDAL